MKRMLWLLVLGIVLLASLSSSQTVSVFSTVYTPPGDPDGPRSGTMFVPAVGNGIGVVIAHGQGATQQSTSGWRDTLAAHGYVVMSIDYPDFGVYPKASRAAKLAVQFLRRSALQFGITTNKIVGVGMSQGAITWGEAIIWDNDHEYFQTDSTIDDHLDAAILLYGLYEYDWSDPGNRAYFSNDSLHYVKGACLKHVSNITTPVLLQHGLGDASVPFQGSVLLFDSLVAQGKVSQLQLFPGQAHGFDVFYPAGAFTPAGLIAKDTALAFLRRTVAPALKVRVSSSSIDFGPLLLSASDTVTLRVDNIGRDPLNLHSVSNGRSEYKLVNLPSLPMAIQPGNSVKFKVAFQPGGDGAVNDTLNLGSDDTLHPVVKISLQGKGIGSISSASAGVLYTTSPGLPDGYLLSLSVVDGTVDTIGPLGVPDIGGLSIRHADGIIYGTSMTPHSTGLYQISATSGQAALIRRFPIGYLGALAFSPGDTLYGAATTGTLYRSDPGFGRTDSLGTSVRLAHSGLSFRPGNGELWASVRTPTDSIYRLTRENGEATPVGATGFNALTSSIAFDPSGMLYGLIDNGTGEDYLAAIDTLTASGSVIAGPLSVNYLHAIAMITIGLPVSVHDRDLSVAPLTFNLSHNYPNPFNPSTVIKYTVGGAGGQGPGVSDVSLVVYDVLGREVAVLVNERKAAGTYEVTFDGSGLSSGSYVYRMTAGSFVQSRKMTLVK